MKKDHGLALAVAGVLCAGMLAGCSAGEPTPDSAPKPDETTSESASEGTETVEQEPAEDRGPDEGATQPDNPAVEFTVDNAQSDQHGVEVSVSFSLEGSAEMNESNVVRAVSRAVDMHPNYDLIIVRGYGTGSDPADGSPTIEAWYMPENVEMLDLSNPAQAEPYEHCYSCHVPGSQHR